VCRLWHTVNQVQALAQVPADVGGAEVADAPVLKRFLSLDEVEAILNISRSQAYALVRSGELAAIRIGGRGIWRVEQDRLEEYIAGAYRRTAEAIAGLPDDEPGG
jgi:excisionase family DNA binding protein